MPLNVGSHLLVMAWPACIANSLSRQSKATVNHLWLFIYMNELFDAVDNEV